MSDDDSADTGTNSMVFTLFMSAIIVFVLLYLVFSIYFHSMSPPEWIKMINEVDDGSDDFTYTKEGLGESKFITLVEVEFLSKLSDKPRLNIEELPSETGSDHIAMKTFKITFNPYEAIDKVIPAGSINVIYFKFIVEKSWLDASKKDQYSINIALWKEKTEKEPARWEYVPAKFLEVQGTEYHFAAQGLSYSQKYAIVAR